MKRTLLVILIASGWTTANALICYHAIKPRCPDVVCTGYDSNGNPTNCEASSFKTWNDIGVNSGISGKRSYTASGSITCTYSCYAPNGAGGQILLECTGGTYYQFMPSGANCTSDS